MPTLSVFIRKDDVVIWKELQNKSEFIHQALRLLGNNPTYKKTRIEVDKNIVDDTVKYIEYSD